MEKNFWWLLASYAETWTVLFVSALHLLYKQANLPRQVDLLRRERSA